MRSSFQWSLVAVGLLCYCPGFFSYGVPKPALPALYTAPETATETATEEGELTFSDNTESPDETENGTSSPVEDVTAYLPPKPSYPVPKTPSKPKPTSRNPSTPIKEGGYRTMNLSSGVGQALSYLPPGSKGDENGVVKPNSEVAPPPPTSQDDSKQEESLTKAPKVPKNNLETNSSQPPSIHENRIGSFDSSDVPEGYSNNAYLPPYSNGQDQPDNLQQLFAPNYLDYLSPYQSDPREENSPRPYLPPTTFQQPQAYLAVSNNGNEATAQYNRIQETNPPFSTGLRPPQREEVSFKSMEMLEGLNGRIVDEDLLRKVQQIIEEYERSQKASRASPQIPQGYQDAVKNTPEVYFAGGGYPEGQRLNLAPPTLDQDHFQGNYQQPDHNSIAADQEARGYQQQGYLQAISTEQQNQPEVIQENRVTPLENTENVQYQKAILSNHFTESKFIPTANRDQEFSWPQQEPPRVDQDLRVDHGGYQNQDQVRFQGFYDPSLQQQQERSEPEGGLPVYGVPLAPAWGPDSWNAQTVLTNYITQPEPSYSHYHHQQSYAPQVQFYASSPVGTVTRVHN